LLKSLLKLVKTFCIELCIWIID